MSENTDGDAHLFAGLAQDMHDSPDADQTVQSALEQATVVLPVVVGVSITVRRRPGIFESIGTGGRLAAEADQLQYELREGPCVDASSPNGREWFRANDLRHAPEWPRWGPGAADLGVGSLLSVQLVTERRPFGAVNLYASRAGEFTDPDDVDRALLWATHVARAVATARKQAGLSTAIAARHAIGMAQGILMERLGLTPDAAFGYLTRLASERERRLSAVAADIVETGEIPDV